MRFRMICRRKSLFFEFPPILFYSYLKNVGGNQHFSIFLLHFVLKHAYTTKKRVELAQPFAALPCILPFTARILHQAPACNARKNNSFTIENIGYNVRCSNSIGKGML